MPEMFVSFWRCDRFFVMKNKMGGKNICKNFVGCKKKGYLCSMKNEQDIENIRDSILKFIPAKCIYLFGSYAYGIPTEDSDVDIYVVTPDGTKDFSILYAKILGDLGRKDIFSIDLLLSTESGFNNRKEKFILEKIISQKGRMIYEHL